MDPLARGVPPDVVAIVWTGNAITVMAPVCKDVLPVGRETCAPNQVRLDYDKGEILKVLNKRSSQGKKINDKKYEKEIEMQAILNTD